MRFSTTPSQFYRDWGEYGILDPSSGEPNQAFTKKIEKVTEQFSSYMNCCYRTRFPTEPISKARFLFVANKNISLIQFRAFLKIIYLAMLV